MILVSRMSAWNVVVLSTIEEVQMSLTDSVKSLGMLFDPGLLVETGCKINNPSTVKMFYRHLMAC